jgi:hypothetical protein
MKIFKLGSHLLRAGFVCAAFAMATTAQAATIEIAFTGMNLVYDGSTIYDAGSSAGGVLNPTQADPVGALQFYLDGNLQGSLNSDVAVDVSIPDVVNIPSANNTIFNVTTTGNPGYFDVLIGTAPSAAEYVALNLGEVNVSYVDVSGLVQFTFGAAVAASSSQNLPFGLEIGDPVTLSFSAQVDANSRTIAGGFITGFEATGTGEIRGEAIPEPSTVALCAMGAIAIPVMIRRRRR